MISLHLNFKINLKLEIKAEKQACVQPLVVSCRSPTHSAVMLFSGLRGMSSSLVPVWTLSWLAVPTIFPVTLSEETQATSYSFYVGSETAAVSQVSPASASHNSEQDATD